MLPDDRNQPLLPMYFSAVHHFQKLFPNVLVDTRSKRAIACPTFVYGLACDYVVFAEVTNHHIQNLFPSSASASPMPSCACLSLLGMKNTPHFLTVSSSVRNAVREPRPLDWDEIILRLRGCAAAENSDQTIRIQGFEGETYRESKILIQKITYGGRVWQVSVPVKHIYITQIE